MFPSQRYLLHSMQDTYDLAYQVVRDHPQGALLGLRGTLGAGKTSFVKGIAQAVGIPPEEITSPTYTYLHLHSGLTHFDLYRIRDAAHFQELGLEEFLYHSPWICIEWCDRVLPLLPSNTLILQFLLVEGEERHIEIQSIAAYGQRN